MLFSNGNLSEEESILEADLFDEFYFYKRRLQYAFRQAGQTLSEAAGVAPELFSYTVGVAVTTPASLSAALEGLSQTVVQHAASLSSAASAITMPTTATLGIALGWNVVVDAPAAIIAGINLILDEDNYRQTQNKVKGVINIISGVQAIALTYNPALELALGLGAGGFAGPAFAFMTLCDLVNASIDFYNANKEVSIEGWLEERVKEINYLDKRIGKLTTELADKEHFLRMQGAAGETLIDDLQQKIKNLQEKKNELMVQVAARSKVYLHDKHITPEEAARRTDIIEKIMDNLTTCSYDKQTGERVFSILDEITDNEPTTDEGNLDKQIQDKLVQEYQDKRIYLIMKGLSFSAMTLFAIAPFVGPAAPALIIPAMVISTFVAGYYIYQHREKIVNTMDSVFKAGGNRLGKAILKIKKRKKTNLSTTLINVTLLKKPSLENNINSTASQEFNDKLTTEKEQSADVFPKKEATVTSLPVVKTVGNDRVYQNSVNIEQETSGSDMMKTTPSITPRSPQT